MKTLYDKLKEDDNIGCWLYIDDFNNLVFKVYNINNIDLNYTISRQFNEYTLYADCRVSNYSFNSNLFIPNIESSIDIWKKFCEDLINDITFHVSKVQNKLIQTIQEQTWLFTDEEVKDIIQKYSQIYLTDDHILRIVQNSKKNMTKEEFELEIKNFAYKYSTDSKEHIDSIIKQHQSLINKKYYDITNEIDDYGDFNSAIVYCRDKIMLSLNYTTDYIDLLVEKVYLKTWLFTRSQIKNKIIDMSKNHEKYRAIDEGYITLYLYHDKETLTKEEYDKEVINYIYLYNTHSKDYIDYYIQNNYKNSFDEWYIHVKNNDCFHAVQCARSSMMSLID